MIKKIKEILFNVVDYNRDGKISNQEAYTAILFVFGKSLNSKSSSLSGLCFPYDL